MFKKQNKSINSFLETSLFFPISIANPSNDYFYSDFDYQQFPISLFSARPLLICIQVYSFLNRHTCCMYVCLFVLARYLLTECKVICNIYKDNDRWKKRATLYGLGVEIWAVCGLG